jgi:hypothetical protein
VAAVSGVAIGIARWVELVIFPTLAVGWAVATLAMSVWVCFFGLEDRRPVTAAEYWGAVARTWWMIGVLGALPILIVLMLVTAFGHAMGWWHR